MKNLHLKSAFVALFFLHLSSSIFAQQFKVLLFTKTDGFHHESINEGVTAIKQLAIRHTFPVVFKKMTALYFSSPLSLKIAAFF